MQAATMRKAGMAIALAASLFAASNAVAAEPCSTTPARYNIAETLWQAAEEHPVHITFMTRSDGVKMPAYLIAKYPDEMTIVLQYEFGKLNVKDDRFEVQVWFKGYPERLVIPFDAIKAFYDRTELKCSGI
jgi:stringent starvation protein B